MCHAFVWVSSLRMCAFMCVCVCLFEGVCVFVCVRACVCLCVCVVTAPQPNLNAGQSHHEDEALVLVLVLVTAHEDRWPDPVTNGDAEGSVHVRGHGRWVGWGSELEGESVWVRV